jgi:hypothetical protein
MKRLGIVAVGLALVVGIIVGGIVGRPFDGKASAQIAGRTPSVSVSQRCNGTTQTLNAEVYVHWYVEEPWDEAYVDTAGLNDGFERGMYEGTPGGAPEPSDILGFWGHVNIHALGGLMIFVRVNLRYGDTWYPSPALSIMVDPCTGGTVVAPAPPPLTAPSLTGPSFADLQRLQSRVQELEDCLGNYPPYQCSFRLHDIEARLENLERGW